MSDSKTVWVPKGMPANLAQALSVPNPGLYQSLLETKLDRLIQADPVEALAAMEMSVEEAPELYSIAQNYQTREWASQIVRGDTLMPLLAQVTAQGTLEPMQEQSLWEILEKIL
jgi:hypothetical protein